MILVGSTNDESKVVLQLGDDLTGQVLYSVQLGKSRAEALVEQLSSVIRSLVDAPEVEDSAPRLYAVDAIKEDDNTKT